jgi:hypothetical protein
MNTKIDQQGQPSIDLIPQHSKQHSNQERDDKWKFDFVMKAKRKEIK